MGKHSRKKRKYALAAAPHRIEPLEPRTLLSMVTWISANGGSWNTAADWSTDAVPAAGSDVVIDQPGNIQITLNGAASIDSLSISGDTLTVSGGTLNVATTVNNSGSINLNTGSQLNVTGAFTQTGGGALALAGNSSVSAGSLSNSGTITIGAAGTVGVIGNFLQTGNGVLDAQLGGAPGGGLFGTFSTDGTADLAGTFEATLANGYAPSVGDAFTLLNYGAESGAFSAYELPSNSTYNFQPAVNSTNLQISALPAAQLITTVNVGSVVNTVSTGDLGVNLGFWDLDMSTPQTQQLVEGAGLDIFRFPGGSSSDDYHFNDPNNYFNNSDSIPDFASFIASVGGTGLITMDYGSGSPQEAEAELAYLTGSPADNTVIGNGIEWNDTTSQWQTVNWQTVGYWASLRAATPLAQDDGLNFLRIGQAAPFTDIKYWEVGNEQYGGWEIDHHGTNLPNGTSTGSQHDPATYVQWAATFASFVAADQANLPNISIGIDSEDPTGAADNAWTRKVLDDGLKLGFTPGFISDHSYMQSPFYESDSFLLNDTVSDSASLLDWTTRYNAYESLLTQTLGSKAAGVQMMATETNSVNSDPGKQTTSLVNGLFLADSIGSMLNSGYVGGFVWDLRDGWDTYGNNSNSLYGWRDGADYGLIGSATDNDPPFTGPYIEYPSYFGVQLASKIVQSGGVVVSAVSSNSELSAYAVLEPNGHLELMVINKNPGAAVNEEFSISGFTPSSQAVIWQYGQAQDNAQSQSPTGASALANFAAGLNVNGGIFNYTVPAYSMTVIDLSPAVAQATPTVVTPAAATPNPVTAATISLSVLGADGAGTSSLLYTWSATALPVGADPPTYSINGTNQSQNTTATVYAAGSYTFTVTFRLLGGPSTTSSVNVTVSQTLTQIAVSLGSPILPNGASEQFSAVGYDQFGNAMTSQPAFTWSLNPGGAGGTITSSGLYTAPAAGTGMDTILAASGGVQGASTVTVVLNGPANVINLPAGFGAAGGSMDLNGNASIGGANLVLTNNTQFQDSSAYYAGQVNVASFWTQFDFLVDGLWPLGDGFTFIIQSSSILALGQDGSGLGSATASSGGTGGIPNSVAVTFDTYHSNGGGLTGLDPDGAYPVGENTVDLTGSNFNLRSYDPSQATLSYNGTTLTETLTDLFTGKSVTENYAVNIPAIVGGNTAWVGFTGADGALVSNQSISSWVYNTTPVVPPAFSSANQATFSTGAPSSFSVTAAGIPTAVLSESGTLPSGISFTSNNNGTASLSGTPAAGSNGVYLLTFTAANGVQPNATQVFTLVVSSGVPVAPATPTGFTATPGVGQVTLNWNLSSGANSYTIQYGTTSGGNYNVTDAGLTGTSTTISGLNNGTAYYFIITAVSNAAGPSAPSGQVTATPVAVPATPTGFAAAAGVGQVTLNWNLSSGANSYTIQYGTTNGSNYSIMVSGLTGTSTTISGLNNGTTYYFVITAVSNTAGPSAPSGQVSATPAAVPPTPTGLTATAGNGQVTLNWNLSSGANSYTIQYGTTNGSNYSITVSGLIGTSTTISGLNNGTTYYFVIYAVSNTSGPSAQSGQVSAMPVAPPPTPTGLVATPGAGQVTLTWNSSSGANSYTIQYGSTNGSNYNTTDSGLTGTTTTISGLNNGTTYYFVILAVSNTTGTSPASGQVSATPVAAPAAPTGFSAIGGVGQVTLSWNVSSGANSYTIKYGTTNGSNYSTTDAGLTGTTTTISGLNNGTTYYFIIYAVNNVSGSSPASGQVSAAPLAIPATPTGLNALPGSGQITLTWNSTAGAATYTIQYGTTNGGNYSTMDAGLTGTTTTIGGLSNGTTYYFVILAVNASGSSSPSGQVSAAPSAAASTISYASNAFSASSSLALNGAARISGGDLVLTNNIANEDASAFYAVPQLVGSFSATFNLQIDGTWPICNGLTFTIQSAGPSALGVGGSGLGYGTANSGGTGGIPDSVAVKFDVYNTSSGDGTTGVYVNGAYPGAGGVDLGGSGFNLRSYDLSQAVINYNGTTLTLVLTDLYTHATATESFAVNIPAIVGSSAYVGFTAGTGAQYSNQVISSWSFSGGSSGTAAPATPTGITATPGNGQVTLNWPAVTGATTYTVADSTASGGPYTTLAINVGASPYTAMNLTNGTPYYFEVSASNTGGTSGWSTPVPATPLASPAVPTGITATPGNGQVTLNWPAVTGAAGYTIADSTASGGPYTTVASNVGSSPYPVTNLTNGTPYYFEVSASNTGGTSGWSTPIQATPLAPPAVPTGVSAVAGNSQATVTWSPSAGAASYTVAEGSGSSGPFTTVMTNLTGTTYTVTNLNNGTTYYFVVYAVNSVATSSASTPAAMATPSAGAGPAPSSVNFAGGFASATGLALNGAAKISGSTIVLTSNSQYQGSSVYYTTPQSVVSFSMTINFLITGTWPIGDGFTIVFQNAGLTALGVDGSGLGYGTASSGGTGGIPDSVAVKFDVYNTSSGDGTTGVYVNGTYPAVNGVDLGGTGFNLRSYDPSQATLNYNGTTLTLVLTDLLTRATATENFTVNIPAIVGSTAYVGFTGGDGALTSNQVIQNWTYASGGAGVPSAPSGVKAAAGTKQVALSWTASPAASSYIIEYGTTNGSAYTSQVSGITLTSDTIPNLTTGTTYYFIIIAVNSNGQSISSEQVSAVAG